MFPCPVFQSLLTEWQIHAKMRILCTTPVRIAPALADFYVDYLGYCFQGFTPYLQSPITLFSCFDLKWGRIWLYPQHGTEQQHMEQGLIRPMWLLERGFECGGTATAVFSFKSSTLCCTCCNNNNTLKQEVTLIHTGVHWSSDFHWGQ